ncbi:alpha-L-rhamnosidase N-terminal domain-containing protein [Cohnella sp. GCM10020058]|uniref:alpha-L-rhamnosidase N-terminal domain-containing protein n=1 Tax=Cohnella sp. GCM10020058 TaxID=3317330 RepID=UPI003635BF5F
MKASWIWYPEGRTLPNTFIFFRRTIQVEDMDLQHARGFIAADSRYQLFVNGVMAQRGPAPFDPRHMEKDAFDLAALLRPGINVIGVLVAYFGESDGTYVMGNPGLLLALNVKYEGSEVETNVITDESWSAFRAKSWRAGHYRRHFLRALQEDFDARLYPHGWHSPDYDDRGWRPARVLKEDDGKPVVWGTFNHLVQYDIYPSVDSSFEPRTIPYMQETAIECSALLKTGSIEWNCPPEEFFEVYTEGAYREKIDDSPLISRGDGDGPFPLTVRLQEGCSSVLVFALPEGITGYPFVRFRAAAGTVAEIVFGEGIGEELMLPMPQKGEWVRVTAAEGETNFAAFDYDAVKYIAVLFRGTGEPVELLSAGAIRLRYPFASEERFRTSDETVNLVYRGAVNSARNVCLETITDNMSRERQQYSGEIGLTKLALYLAFGEYRLPERMIRTFSKGQYEEGWFLDCFPASDRLERLPQRVLGLSSWGPLLDHGIGFIYDIAEYTLHTGEMGLLHALRPVIARHYGWLESMEASDGMLPVEGLGLHVVWLDHHGYAEQRDRQATLNIYYYGYWLKLAAIADWTGDRALADKCVSKLQQLKNALFAHFWDEQRGMFVDNLPWLDFGADGKARIRQHDRSLSMALLFDLIPESRLAGNLDALTECPPELGLSHPVNAGWRLWALSKYRRSGAIVRDLRDRWGAMNSLHENGTLAEDWSMKPDQNAWCQCSVAPIYIAHGELLGVRPLSPGFCRYRIAPQSGGLAFVEGTTHTPNGPVRVALREREGLLELELPAGLQAELRLPGPLVSAESDDADADVRLKEAAGLADIVITPSERMAMTLRFAEGEEARL